MFEKEAEEYTLNKLVGLEDFDNYQSAYDRYENGVQDAFKDGAEFGYNKANEWHYVKDGLPEELHNVFCFVIHNEHRFVLQGYLHLRDGRWVLSPLRPDVIALNNDDVIAWKEIVLPELKESR